MDEVERRQPLNYAPITLIVGDQGSGKSTVLAAKAVDPTFAGATSVILESGYEVPVGPVLNNKGKPIVGYVTVMFPDKEPFVAEVPEGACVVARKLRVFANYHFYGIRYMRVDLADILEHLNDDLFVGGIINIDETYLDASARNSMGMLTQLLSGDLSFQIRKRHMCLNLSYPLARQADVLTRLSRTEYIECSYDPATGQVTVDTKRNGKLRKRHAFDGSLYRPYFDTDERFAIREHRINKALAQAY